MFSSVPVSRHVLRYKRTMDMSELLSIESHFCPAQRRHRRVSICLSVAWFSSLSSECLCFRSSWRYIY